MDEPPSAHLFWLYALAPAVLFFAAWFGAMWRRERLALRVGFLVLAIVSTTTLGFVRYFSG